MKRRDVTRDILMSARHDVKLIRDLAQEGHSFLESRAKMPTDVPFSAEEKEQLRAVEALLCTAAEGKGKKSTTHVSDKVAALVLHMTGNIKQRTFLAEMTLGYLVSRLEAFLKDCIEQYLLEDVRRLRSGAYLTYEQALSYPSMSALKRYLANLEASKLGGGNIDEVAQALEKRFAVRFSEFEKWEEVREVVYRRHIFVHNKGEIDQVYRLKTGYKGNRIILSIDGKYLSAACSSILEFFDFVNTKLIKSDRKNTA